MNIIQAMNSGGRIKRKEWKHSLDSNNTHLQLMRAEIIADDWEVEEKPIDTFSWNLALDTALKSDNSEGWREVLEALKK